MSSTVWYKTIQIDEYQSDLETRLNTLGFQGWELLDIYNGMAVLISGSSGIVVSGSLILPAGVVSSSNQVIAYLPGGVVSSSTQVVYTSLQNIPAGIVSSSAQVKVLLPNGTVSSSTQAATWTVATASYYALPFDIGAYATTGSNTLIGNQIISGSLTLSSGSALNINNGFYVDGNRQFNYGAFSDTTTQSGSADTAYSMKFNTTDLAVGFSVVSGTRITATNTGIYNLQFSAQLDNASNTNEIVDIWIAVTGSNVPNSNTRVAINKAQAGNKGKLVAAWNYMLPLSASQYVELKWTSDGGNIILLAEGTAVSPTRPAVPSVIATITQIV